MNKDEIKKALECCSSDVESCAKCPYDFACTRYLCKDALNLIAEQEKEIERLKTENGQRRKLGILGNEVAVEFHDDEVSEHSVDCNDIEKYAKQFRNRIIYLNEKEIKQAKIDMLNEVKKCSQCDNFFPDGNWHRYVLVSDIDILIEEVENDK